MRTGKGVHRELGDFNRLFWLSHWKQFRLFKLWGSMNIRIILPVTSLWNKKDCPFTEGAHFFALPWAGWCFYGEHWLIFIWSWESSVGFICPIKKYQMWKMHLAYGDERAAWVFKSKQLYLVRSFLWWSAALVVKSRNPTRSPATPHVLEKPLWVKVISGKGSM